MSVLRTDQLEIQGAFQDHYREFYSSSSPSQDAIEDCLSHLES